MRHLTDTEMLNWIERQSNGAQWVARHSGRGRGFRLHNTTEHPFTQHPTAREAISHAMNKEPDGMSEL